MIIGSRTVGRSLLATLALAGVSIPAIALAQATTASNDRPVSISEVVVTAQKRAEPLQKVPVSVTAVQGQSLEQIQATRLQDWSGFVPGLVVGENGSPGLSNLSLDGIGPVSAASEVGVYINDTPLGASSSFEGGNGFTPDLMPYDLNRVEVLRGPQGTLYGASTMGGLIKYVLSDPDLDHLSGRIGGDLFGVQNSGGVGGGVRGAFNAPLLPGQLALHVSAYDENTPGYIDNFTTGQQHDNALRQYGGRAALLWKPMPDLSIEASALYQRSHADNQAIVALDQTTDQPIGGPLSNINTRPEPYTQTLQLYDLRFTWDLHFATLTSVTSYEDFGNDTIEDLTDYLGVYLGLLGAPGPGQADFLEHYDLHKFTQEVRLASPTGQRIEWQVGGFYTHETGVNQETFRAFDDTGAPLAALTPLEFAYLPSTYKEYAFFGDLTFHVTSWFDLSGGLRYAHNDQSFTESEGGALLDPAAPTTPVVNIPGSSSEGVVTYMISPSFHITKNGLLYGRIATGYQPGGPNVILPGVTGLPTQFNSSRLTDYQVGFKSTFLDGRASFDLSVFDIEWSKIQVSVLIGDQSAIENAGKARSQGVDASATWSPINGLDLAGTLSYDDATLTAPVASIGALSGARLPYAPMWSGSFRAEYSTPIADQWKAFAGAGYRFAGTRYSAIEGSISNGAPQGLEAKFYDIVDAHVGARTHGLTISLFAKNLFDSRAYVAPLTYFNSFIGAPIDIKAPVVQPRTVGVSVDKSF